MAEIIEQYKITGTPVENLLLNGSVRLSRREYGTLIQGETVTFPPPAALDIDALTDEQFLTLSIDQFEGMLIDNFFSPSKLSLFLRVAGRASDAFAVSDTLCIDATNHSRFAQSTLYVKLDTDGTGGGSMTVNVPAVGYALQAAGDSPSLTYPVSFDSDLLRTVWLRVKAAGGQVDIGVNVDGQRTATASAAVTAGTWSWVSTPLVLPDRAAHDLSFTPLRNGLSLDKIYFTTGNDTPTGVGPDYDDSPFVTAHVQIFTTHADGSPFEPLSIYDAATTATLLTDDWYNFDTGPLGDEEGIVEMGRYAVVLSASGGSSGHFVTWDLAAAEGHLPSSSYDGTWTIDPTLNYSLRLYSGRVVSSACAATGKPAAPYDLVISDFDPADSEFVNTRIDADEYTFPFGRIVLDARRRIVTFVLDQSGSMTWNDPDGERHGVIERLAGRLDAVSPVPPDYNLLTFQSTPLDAVFFATTTQVGKDDPVTIASQFFKASALDVAGVRVVRKEGSFPSYEDDGRAWDGLFSSFSDTGLTPGVTYYYAVYTFDKNWHFSPGVKVAVKAAARNVPVGVTSLTATPVPGTGVVVDGGVAAAWHLGEGEGSDAFDFGHDNLHLTGSGVRWLNTSEVPIGYSGIRFDGSLALRSSPSSHGAASSKLTVMAWVWPLGDGVIVSRQKADASSTNYVFKIVGGKLALKPNATTTVTSTATPTPGVWSHVAVTHDYSTGRTEFFVNGVSAGSATGGATTTDSTAMVVTLGGSAVAANLFARMTEVSVHSVVRPLSYIAAAAVPNDDPLQDNGDRIVRFSWFQPYQSQGRTVIYENFRHVPSFVGDGAVVYDSSVTAGDRVAAYAYPFRAGRTVYYRIFTQNTGGNYSSAEDSASASPTIPALNATTPPAPPSPGLAPAVSFSATPLNGKAKLEWVYPTDARITGLRIFSDDQTYPVVTRESFTGALLYDADLSDVAHVHRPLTNNQQQFYTAVTIDNAGDVSSSSYATATPNATLSDPAVLPPDVVALRSEPVNETTISLAWENPVPFRQGISGYLNDPILLYGMLADRFGRPLTGLQGVKFSVSGAVATPNSSPDVFNDTRGQSFAASTSYSITTSYDPDTGLVTGGLTFNAFGPAATAIKQVVYSVKLTANVVNDAGATVFSYASPGVYVTLLNPLSITLSNVNNDVVLMRTRLPNNSYSYQPTNGAYASRNSPIILRATVAYRGQPVTGVNVQTRVIDTTTKLASTGVLVPAVLSTSGTSVDVSVVPPKSPSVVLFYARTALNGFSYTTTLPLTFKNPLQLEVTPNPPRADGSNSAEQSVRVWYVDPNNNSITLTPPDRTVVRWSLTGDGSSSQPFYSNEGVPLGNGVYSYTHGGSSRHVFVGPLSGLQRSGAVYTVTATTVWNGQSGNDLAFLNVLPVNANFAGAFVLSEFPDTVNDLYADGIRYVKLAIVSDPTTYDGYYSDCFLSCSAQIGNPVITVPVGTILTVTTEDNFEIITGDVIETYDAYDDVNTLDTSGATISYRQANVILTGLVTYVYFRFNGTNVKSPPAVSVPPHARCDCFNASGLGDTATGTGVSEPVFVQGSLVVGGKPLPLFSGGYDGLPPTVISLVEPLVIRLADVRSASIPSDVIVVDGVTKNQIVFEVSFSGKPVPVGTPVKLTLAGMGLPTLPSTLYTNTRIDQYINESGPAKSFATLTLPILSPATAINAVITAEVNYDKTGLTQRTQKLLVSISYAIGESIQDNLSTVFSGGLFKLTGGAWTQGVSMGHPRGALCLEYANGNLYALGGMNGRTVSQFNEKFDGTSWTLVSDMPTPRAYAQSAVVGGKVYVVGGIAADSIDHTVHVSRSLEVYDPVADTWDTLASMPFVDTGGANPLSYGVAMGTAVAHNNKIWVFSGFCEVQNDTTWKSHNADVKRYNDRVLVYDITSDTWNTVAPFTGTDLLLYSRLSPFAYLDGSTVHVSAGLYYDISTPFGDVRRDYVTTSYKFDTSGTTIASDDAEFVDLPSPRYRGDSVRVGNDVYFLGGTDASAPNLTLVERADVSSPPATLAGVDDMPLALHSFACATDGTSVYACGGVSSGRSSDFVQVSVGDESSMRLSGKQNVAIRVQLRDHNWNPPADAEVYMSANSGTGDAVVFSDQSFVVSGGLGSTVVRARGEDTSAGVTSIVSGVQHGKYEIAVGGTVFDPFYAGASADAVETPFVQTGGLGLFGGVATLKGSVRATSSDRGVFINSYQVGDSPFAFLPAQMSQGLKGSVNCYSDIDSVPTVTVLLGGNGATAAALSAAMRTLDGSVPFGYSPLFDAMERAMEVSYDDAVSEVEKNFYLLTDDKADSSVATLPTVLTDLDALGAEHQTPVVTLAFAVNVPPLGDSRPQDVSPAHLDRIAEVTDGQSFGVIAGASPDDVINDAAGRLAGSVGYGVFRYTFDLADVAVLRTINLNFTVPSNATASWKFRTSVDGLVYGPWGEDNDPEHVETFDGLEARFVKLSVILSSGLSVGETGVDETTPADVPALDSVEVSFNKTSVDHVFLNLQTLSANVDEAVVAMDSDRPDEAEVEIGVAAYDAHTWRHFQTPAQPAVVEAGKVVTPYRLYGAEASAANESLDGTDGFLFRARYGPWSPAASVAVFDSTGSAVAVDDYSTYPDSGCVVFRSRTTGSYSLSVADKKEMKVGVRITNKSDQESVVIRGVGVMYTKR